MNRSEAGKLGAIKSAELAKQRKLQRIEDYNSNPKLCEECSGIIPYKKKGSNCYCSRSCSAKNTNRARASSGMKTLDRKNKHECCYCSKELYITKYKKKFCNVNCQQDYQREKALKENKASSVSIRTYLIKKYGSACMECGWNKINPYTKKVPIELEHIDGDSENNSLSNLKLLCPCCHSLTATYKGANRGKGRHSRRQRYAEGKSY